MSRLSGRWERNERVEDSAALQEALLMAVGSGTKVHVRQPSSHRLLMMWRYTWTAVEVAADQARLPGIWETGKDSTQIRCFHW